MVTDPIYVLDLGALTVQQASVLNRVSLKVRSEYPSLIEKIAGESSNDIHWAVSNIASRNKYYSLLFLRLCRLSLVIEIAKSQKTIQVITSDFHLYQTLKTEIVLRNVETILKSFSWHKKTKRFFVPFYKYSIAIKKYFSRLLSRSKGSQLPFGSISELTLLDTYVINSKVGDSGSIVKGNYKDRYYPGLFSALSEEEKKKFYYVPTLIGFKNNKKAFDLIRSSREQFLIRDDYLLLSDYLFALLHPFKILKKKYGKVIYEGIDITPLIKGELWDTCVNFNSMEGLLNYRFAYRLARSGVNIRMYVEWYENQPMDKGAIAGFHEFLPRTKTIGYQGYIISRVLHHYVYPTAFEKRLKVVPDEVAVMGKALQTDILEYCSDVKVVVAPAFRNQNVWKGITNNIDNSLYILVALPMDKNEVNRILYILSKTIEEISSFQVIVKPHPSYGPEILTKYLFIEQYNVKIATGKFEEVLRRNMIVVTNASITAVESIAMGVPSIIIGDINEIVQNPIPPTVPKEFWRICYSPNELKDAIAQFKKTVLSESINYSEITDQIRKDYFEKFTVNTARQFLKLPLIN